MLKVAKDGDIVFIDGSLHVVRRVEHKLEYFEIWFGCELKLTCWSEAKALQIVQAMRQEIERGGIQKLYRRGA